jgi:hypothetical protein
LNDSACKPTDVAVGIVSFHEQMQGWLALLNKARTSAQIVLAYRKLDELGRSFFEMEVLPFSDDAQEQICSSTQPGNQDRHDGFAYCKHRSGAWCDSADCQYK